MTQILLSFGMAVLIGLVTMFSKIQKGEPFSLYKLLRTALIGLVLGGVSYFSGLTITQENWEMYMASNAGVVGIVDQVVKIIWRAVMKVPIEG